MSSCSLSGFFWPSPASMGPQVKELAVPEKPSATPSLKVSSTATAMSRKEKATPGSGAPPVSISVVSPSSASRTSGSPPQSSFSGSQGPRTGRVQITSTITVTPSVPALDTIAPKLFVGESRQISEAGLVHTSTKGPAPEATVAFQMHKQEGSTSHMVIAGGLFGALALILLVAFLIASCRRRKRADSKRSQAEKGKARSGNKYATRDMINEAHERRKDRNRRTGKFNVQASVLTPADMSDMMHQGNVTVAEYYAPGQHDGCRSEHSSASIESVQWPTHMVTRQGIVRAYPIAATPSHRHSLSDDSVSPMGRSFDIVDLENISPFSSPNEFGGDGQTH